MLTTLSPYVQFPWNKGPNKGVIVTSQNCFFWLFTIYKKIPEILVGNFRSVRMVRIVYHLPKISGLSRRGRLDSSYNMKMLHLHHTRARLGQRISGLDLLRNSRNLYMVNEFPFGMYQSGKWEYLFRISVCPENFPVERTKKLLTIYIPTGISGNLW